MNEILKVIYERRAIRKYKNVPVEKKIIEQVIDAGRMAPSAMNQQLWSFLILEDGDKIKALSMEIATMAQKYFRLLGGVDLTGSDDIIFHHAPVVILVTAPKDNEWAPLEVGMCAQNMMLAAKSLGLDTCPVGFAKYANHANMLPQLHIPKGSDIQLAIILGYGDEKPKLHKRKKDNAHFLSEK